MPHFFELNSGAARWRAGSKDRIMRRRQCEMDGLCTTCFGEGKWRARVNTGPPDYKIHLLTVICPNCRGSKQLQPNVELVDKTPDGAA